VERNNESMCLFSRPTFKELSVTFDRSVEEMGPSHSPTREERSIRVSEPPFDTMLPLEASTSATPKWNGRACTFAAAHLNFLVGRRQLSLLLLNVVLMQL